MSEIEIRIDGLTQFTRNLRKADRDLSRTMRLALDRAAQIVIDEARPKVPKRSGRASASIRPQSTSTAVRVSAGGRRAPYYPWLDFGGRVGRRKRTWRQFMKEGRYLYPAYFAKRGEVRRILEDTLLDAISRAGVAVE